MWLAWLWPALLFAQQGTANEPTIAAFDVSPMVSVFQPDPETGDRAYDDGGGILVTPEDQERYSLTVNGRLQVRYSLFDDNGPFRNAGLNEFELERVRLGFRGFAYEKFLKYNIGTDWDSDGAGGTAFDGALLHAFVQLRLQEALGIGWGDRTSLRAGFWRTNFGRQTAESSKRLQFVDRSLTSVVFNLGRNTGLGLLGRFSHNYRPVEYELALINGFGTAGNRPRTELDTNLGFAARIHETIIGDYEPGESDNQLSPFQALRVGGSFAFTRRTRRGQRGASQEFDASPAFLLASDVAADRPFFRMDQLPGAEREYDLWLAGVEADWKHCGWSLHSEYLFRVINRVRFASNDKFNDFTHGFYVQGGYFITEKVELVARHSSVFSHGRGSASPIPGGYDNSAAENGGGINFYFRGHNAKLQFDLFYYDGAPISASALNLVAGDEGLMFRTQYQIAF